MKSLKIKDFAEQRNLALKQPVCFDCFTEILRQMETTVNAQEKERDMYKNELQALEQEFHSLGRETQLQDELSRLEAEERDLDEQIERLDL